MGINEKINSYLDRYPRWVRVLMPMAGIVIGCMCFFWFLPRRSYVTLSALGALLSFASVFLLLRSLIRFASMGSLLFVSMLSMIFVVVPVGRYFEGVYLEREFASHGSIVKGYAFKEKLGKPQTTKSGRYVYYFYIIRGSKFEGVVETDEHRSGDTLLIQYSDRDPEIHRLAN